MYLSLIIPFCGWFSLERDPEWKGWKFVRTRGRTQGLVIHVRVPYGFGLTWHAPGLPYWKLVGFERKPSVDWMLDEYDSSFNEFAAASLRYHLDFSVVDNSTNVERRALYEDLIARLTEPRPRFTREEMDELKAIDAAEEAAGVPLFIPMEPGNRKAGYTMRPSSEREDEIHDAQQARDDAYHARIQQARHDFVDIMPGLWS